MNNKKYLLQNDNNKPHKMYKSIIRGLSQLVEDNEINKELAETRKELVQAAGKHVAGREIKNVEG